MIEKQILLENIDPSVFFGKNNDNIILIKNLFPKLKLTFRGSTIKAIGEKESIIFFEKKIKELEKYCAQFNTLNENIIIDIVKKETTPVQPYNKNLILHGVKGKAIYAKTKNQKKLVKEFKKNNMIFAIGPAGSGKTYTAIALAVKL